MGGPQPRAAARLLLAVALGAGGTMCASPDSSGQQAAADTVQLPSPRTEGGAALAEVLRDRHSVRSFTATPLTEAELGQLLWAGQGITRDWGARTAPSAGGLFPTELYVLDAAGLGWYRPETHTLERLAEDDRRAALSGTAHGQDAVADAPTVIVVTAVPARTSEKYGERAERYCFMEAGHVAQSILLQAVALELGGVPIGAFDDAQVSALLDLPAGTQPIYLLPIGHPAE